MIETPQITQTAARITAMIPLTVPRPEIQNVMGPGIEELMAAVATQGIGPAGPWFTHHLRMDPEVFDFEICVPVTTPVQVVGPESSPDPADWRTELNRPILTE